MKTKTNRKSREFRIAEKHLNHCRYMNRRDPNNKYWQTQIKKTEKILGL